MATSPKPAALQKRIKELEKTCAQVKQLQAVIDLQREEITRLTEFAVQQQDHIQYLYELSEGLSERGGLPS